MSELYLTLDSVELEKQKETASKRAVEQSDDPQDVGLVWNDLELSDPNLEFEDGTLNVNGDFGPLGYLSLSIDIDLDTAADIVEYYLKRLNKLKTVLEAVK